MNSASFSFKVAPNRYRLDGRHMRMTKELRPLIGEAIKYRIAKIISEPGSTLTIGCARSARVLPKRAFDHLPERIPRARSHSPKNPATRKTAMTVTHGVLTSEGR